VGQRHRFHLVVSDVQTGGFQSLVQLLQFKAHLHPQLGVKVRQRLVKQEHRRLAHNGAAHRHALALTTGQLARLAMEQRLQLQNPRRFFHPLANLRFAEAANFQAVSHVVVNAHVRVERVVLEHHRNTAIFRFLVGDAFVADIDIAAGGLLQARHHAQQCRFAAAGRTDHHHEFAVRHVEINRLNHLSLAVIGFGDGLKF